MSSGPLVSVVMPSLNQAEFIRRAIESVLSQAYRPIEVIVVDGVSTDGTPEILGAYSRRIRWVSEPDKGQTPAINKGFRMAAGEVIGWLNADDLYLSGAVQAAVTYLMAHPDIDLLYGDADHIDVEGRIIDRYPTESFSIDRLRETCFICQPAVFFRRRVFDLAGLLDENLNCSMDYDYWIRIAKQARVAYLPVRLAQSRLHVGAKTLRLRSEHQRASMEIVKRHFGSVPASWLCAYATAVVERRVPRRTRWQRVCFGGAVTLLSAWESIRINRGLPRGSVRAWLAWLLRRVPHQQSSV